MEEYSGKPKKRGIGKKIFTILTIIVVLAAASFVFFKFYFVFGSGVKAGELNLFVYKGYVFKTYEGRLIQAGYNSKNSNGGQVCGTALQGIPWHFDLAWHEQVCGRQCLFSQYNKRVYRVADCSSISGCNSSVAPRNLQLPDFHFIILGDDFNPSIVFAEPLVLRPDAEDEGLFFFSCCNR